MVNVPVVDHRGIDERDLDGLARRSEFPTDHSASEGVVDGLPPPAGRMEQPRLRDEESGLLLGLADNCLRSGLSCFDPATRHCPEPVIRPTNKQHIAFHCDDEGVRAFLHPTILGKADLDAEGMR
jgi:hypothetical protein